MSPYRNRRNISAEQESGVLTDGNELRIVGVYFYKKMDKIIFSSLLFFISTYNSYYYSSPESPYFYREFDNNN